MQKREKNTKNRMYITVSFDSPFGIPSFTGKEKKYTRTWKRRTHNEVNRMERQWQCQGTNAKHPKINEYYLHWSRAENNLHRFVHRYSASVLYTQNIRLCAILRCMSVVWVLQRCVCVCLIPLDFADYGRSELALLHIHFSIQLSAHTKKELKTFALLLLIKLREQSVKIKTKIKKCWNASLQTIILHSEIDVSMLYSNNKNKKSLTCIERGFCKPAARETIRAHTEVEANHFHIYEWRRCDSISVFILLTFIVYHASEYSAAMTSCNLYNLYHSFLHFKTKSIKFRRSSPQ